MACREDSTKTAEEEEISNLEQEVTEGNWTRPEVEVHEVKVETGEEDEDTLWRCRAKLYRWAAGGEWKERGLGDAKLLQHKQTKKVRFLLRQEKTLKIVANHYVVSTGVYCKLSPNVSSEKILVWTVMDFAEEKLKNEQFALKFAQVEQAREFKAKFEEAAAINAKLFGVEEESAAAKTEDTAAAETEESAAKEGDTPAAKTEEAAAQKAEEKQTAAPKEGDAAAAAESQEKNTPEAKAETA